MTRIISQANKNVFSVIMDIFEMDHFREPEMEEVQLFLENMGTQGSIVNENVLEFDCSFPKIQARTNVLFDLDDSIPSAK